ncbi:MAG TPA: outer membrane protein assembly factor BamD [bacterium]
MNNFIMRNIIVLLLVFITLAGCNRKTIKPNLSPEERMAKAQKMFSNGDYLDAKTEFRIIILNFPGGSLSDQAQFYLAECHYNLKEHILAGEEYKKLIRAYPNSEYVDDAQFKIAMSNYKLSPKSPLDQNYTDKAIEEFQRFLEDYPNSDLVPEANKFMKKSREKLGDKNFKIADSYRKRAFFRSAIIYYDYVLDNYYDTPFAEKSLWEKAECYRQLGDQDQAGKFYKLYLEKYPKSSNAAKAKDLLSSNGNNKNQD